MKKIILSLFFVSLSSISGSTLISSLVDSLRNANLSSKIALGIGAACGLSGIGAQLASKYYLRLLPEQDVKNATSASKITKDKDPDTVFYDSLKASASSNLEHISYINKAKYLHMGSTAAACIGMWSIMILGLKKMFFDERCITKSKFSPSSFGTHYNSYVPSVVYVEKEPSFFDSLLFKAWIISKW